MLNWVKLFFPILIFLIQPGWSTAQPESKKVFYESLAAADVDIISKEIQKQEADNSNASQAYIGALMMKKAGLLKNPVNKLKEFRSGREKLEAAISTEPDNTEFKMLRLMTQENAPSFLGYNKNLEEDGQWLRDHYKKLEPSVLKVLISYSKSSSILKPTDFK